MKKWPSFVFFLSSLCPLCLCGESAAEDWINWRGPAQDGTSADKDLPESFKPEPGPGSNLLWKQPYGCRSTPLVMNDRVYVINAAGEGEKEGERVMCFDATINGVRTLVSGTAEGEVIGLKVNTGERLWGYRVTTDAVNCTPIVDGTRVYVTHGASNPDTNALGRIVCFDAGQITDGKPKL